MNGSSFSSFRLFYFSQSIFSFHFFFWVIKHKNPIFFLHRFRISSQEVSSDVTVDVGEASFSLHKVNSRSKFTDQSL